MTKKLISILMAITLVVSASALGISSSALIDTTITYGDINGDKIVSTKDATRALEVASGLSTVSNPELFKKGDVNGDGAITLYDARQILRSCASIVNLQPKGDFKGFESTFAGINDAETAVLTFNTLLNRIKTEKPGFIRTNYSSVEYFDIDNIEFLGLDFGTSSETVSGMIREMIVSEIKPDDAIVSIKGENCDNAMSVETENYVSNLSADDVLGVRVTHAETEEANTVTISIALADCGIENVTQTAYGDVFNSSIIQESSKSVVEGIFGANTPVDEKNKNVENGVVTVTFDTSDGSVLEYKTSYITKIKIKESNFEISKILSARLEGVEYQTKAEVVYNDFQW